MMTVRNDSYKLVRVDQVMQLYSRFPISAAVTLILATILLFTQWPVIPHLILIGWWAGIVVITILRLLLLYGYHHIQTPTITIETWAAWFLLGTIFAGLAWGAAGFLLLPEHDLMRQLILVFTLSGLASSSVTTLGSVWLDISIFLSTMLAPITLRFFLLGGAIYQVMGVMTLMYLFGLLLTARYAHNIILEVLNLRTSDIIQETKLLESEAKYRNVVERSNDGIGVIQDGRIIYVNERLAGLIGYKPEQVIGTSFISHVHPTELPVILERYHKRTSGQDVPSMYESLMLHRDGREIPIEVNVGVIPYQNRPAELVIVRDISERKQVQDALRESEDRYRALFNHASDYIFIVDPLQEDSPLILDVNEYACIKHGYTRDELIGKPYSIVNDKDTEEEITDKAQRILAGEILNFESVHIRKDGYKFPVEVSARLIKVKEKPIMISIVRDITERKQAEEQIKTALKEKEILLKEIHHRVKNNLQIISSLLSLQSRYNEDKRTVEVFRNSQERIRAMAIAHEKLYQSKDLAQIDFCDYISSLITYLFESYSLKASQVELKTRIENIFINLETAIPLGLIVNELVSNSLKHAFPGDKKGIIHVALSKCEDERYDYTMVIGDNGVGLAQGTDLQYSGSLGMVLVESLIKQLHGIMKLETSNGMCFTIKFKKLKH